MRSEIFLFWFWAKLAKYDTLKRAIFMAWCLYFGETNDANNLGLEKKTFPPGGTARSFILSYFPWP